MLVILLNCVTLGMYQPCEEGNCDTTRCKILQVFDDFIFAFFTLEMAVKMIAMGVYGKGTYLADSWNRLDFFIVLAGALEYCLNVENKNLSAIRTIRVLRPLRAINRIPSMRILVMLLLDTLPMLGNVLLLCFFVFFIFGIVGVQLWQGILRQRCYLKQIPNISYPEEIENRTFYSIRSRVTSPLALYYQYIEQDKDYICSRPDDNGMHKCENLPHYREGNMICNDSAVPNSMNRPTDTSCVNWNQYYTECMSQGNNPFQGTISFDNIGLAWVAIFLVISLEGWTDIMYYVQDAHSFWDWIYFVLLIVIGSFFMINLCLVVIATQFSETKKREMERMRLERARFHSTSTLASSTNNSEPTTCYAEIVKYVAHLWRRAKRKLLKNYRVYRYKKQHEQDGKLIIDQNTTDQGTGIPSTGFSMQYCGGHDGPGPPIHRYPHHHCHHHRQNQYRHVYHPCPHAHHTCRHHHFHCRQSSRHISCLSPPGSKSADAAAEDQPAPHASPEASDIDPQGTPRRYNPAGLLRVPSNNNTWNENVNEAGQCGSMLLSPPSTNGQRRRSSVMFSDEVTTLAGETKNVCSSEKMTQTVDGELWQSGRSGDNQIQSLPDLNLAEIGNETMTCQELLAFSGALSAALPTGQLALESLFNSLTKGAQERPDCGQRWIEADRCSCCDVYPVCPSPEWSILVDGHKDSLVSKNRRSRFGNFWREFGKCILYCLCNIRRFIKALVEHKYFQQGILLAILFNTLSMGIEYHNQPLWLTVMVEISNIVFSAIFAVEMLLKIVAEGPFGYVSNGFNVFDGVIVILSVVELCQTFLDSEGNERGGGSGLSVLRTFRLLRILKLVRFLPNLRRQLFVMLRTMDNVAVFFSLLILFIFIFSILGMNLFGCKFYYDTPDGHRHFDRKNFDSLLWALVTVFQILTQEDWNVVLFNGMEKTSHWAALYFVALMTFGNYVLFNLLVAILVEGFSSERNERREREARELEKQREKAAEIAAALFEEATRSSSSSESAGMTLHERLKNKWRSAEDIHQSGFKMSKMNDLKAKENLWKLKQNLDLKKSDPVASPPMPPLITHTAATPQDSPNATVDSNVRDFTNKITPSSAFYSSSLSIDSIDRSASSQSSIPGLLKPPKTVTVDDAVSDSSRLGVNKNSSPGKKSNPCTPRRVRSWRVTRPSLKRKSRRGSGTMEGNENQEQEVILNNNHIHLSNGSDHIRCNGNLAVTNTIRNDTQSHKSLSPQSSIRSRLSSRDSAYAPLPQIAWSEANTIHQVSNKMDNLNQAIITNGAKTNEKNSGQNESVHPKTINISSGSVAPSDSPHLSKGNVNEEQVITLESGENMGPTSAIADTIPKVFYFFDQTGCFKERDNFSLYIFPPDNKFRQSCTWIVDRKWFDNVVLLFIGLNCITLAMERPNIPPDSTERMFLLCANYIFTVVFALEMMVKVIATGMFYGENAYFTSGWNIMDGSLVIISIVDLLMSLLSESSPRIFGILRVFRLLRSLRPLRVINRAPGLKLVVQTLLSSLRPIGNIVLICCTFFIIFGILGVQLFKGTFYYCEGPTLEGVRSKSDCISADSRNRWTNRKYNFDDLGKALLSLFILSSRDGWVNIMYTGLDAVGVDLQPVKNYSEWRLLYFIAFILLVGFFVLNMFVGVVVENFHRCREEQEKEERMLRLAKRAKQMEKKRRKMHEPPYYINYSKPRLVIHNVVTSKYFDLAIAAVIGLNVVTMATEFHLMPRPLTYALKIFNYFFTAVFILELIMKLVALGIRLYLKDRWNQLDIAIVFLSIVGIVLEELESKIIPINPTIIRVMRVLRIARVLKLLKMAKGIRALLDTVMQALPQVGNLGLLFFLLFFIFAALGVELFGRLECSDKLPCQGLGEHAHFANFGMAFLTLFRVATGDNWNGIMKDTLRDDCEDNPDCVKSVSTIIAPIFFVIFVLMAQFVLVNVVVAVLMKHLEESHKQMEDELDMEVELERELQQEQEVMEEELCLQALNAENQANNPIKRPLGKVLSLPANFIYHTGASSKDSSALKIDDPGSRRGSSISYQSSYQVRRRQTLHAYSSLFPPSYPAAGYTSVYTTDQDGVSKQNEAKKAETALDRKRLLRRMSSIDSRRRTSVSAASSRRGSLIRPRTELQTLLSKSVGLVPFPTPKQLLSLTELVVDEKEREKRILRKALSMETRSPSEDISPDNLSPSSFMVPPPYPGEKSLLKAPEEEKYKRSERRPSMWQSKQEGPKPEEAAQRNQPRKSISLEKRKSIFKQMSLDSKQALYDKSKEISPEEIAMIIHERRPPHLRDLSSKDIRADELHERRSPMRRQMTAPVSETAMSKLRRPSLTRQDRQEVIANERMAKSDEKDDLQLSVLERRSSLTRKPLDGGSEETAETTLAAPEKTWRPPPIKDNKFFGASMENTSTSSNSTNVTNLRSDSVVSEDTEKNEASRKEEDKVEEGGEKETEKKSGSNERLIGTSSEECCDTSEEDKPKTRH
ncbi:UNVERIFIED_CONTAM: hypothetical protein PYX00_001187 [Menopon gallinae]|uniref:Ion transport domain-containing protein n=1 Tax=Menopon gallinae TaxID=328185 RepID=A0AAW2ID53_9NEOP